MVWLQAVATWVKGWEITAWRMPLAQVAEEFAAAGFLIERLLEPTLAPGMALSHPTTFERLSTEPGFVLFKLRKTRAWTHASMSD